MSFVNEESGYAVIISKFVVPLIYFSMTIRLNLLSGIFTIDSVVLVSSMWSTRSHSNLRSLPLTNLKLKRFSILRSASECDKMTLMTSMMYKNNDIACMIFLIILTRPACCLDSIEHI